MQGGSRPAAWASSTALPMEEESKVALERIQPDRVPGYGDSEAVDASFDLIRRDLAGYDGFEIALRHPPRSADVMRQPECGAEWHDRRFGRS